MANSKQAEKRVRQAEKSRVRNVMLRSKARTYIKKLRQAIAIKDIKNAKIFYCEVTSIVDGMVSKGLYHKNKAARYKSRLNKQVKNLAV